MKCRDISLQWFHAKLLFLTKTQYEALWVANFPILWKPISTDSVQTIPIDLY